MTGPKPLDLKLGAVIRKHRHAAGLSLREVATKSCISDVMLSKYETGKVRVSVSRLDKIARALGTTGSKLVREAEDA